MNVSDIKRIYSSIGTLIPLSSSKKPTLPNWQKKTDFPNQLFNNEKYGIRPHKGYVVVDLDVKGQHNGVYTIESIGVNVHDTLNATTPSGGKHLWYKIDDSMSLPNAVEILPGIDLRVAEKGQVAAWPMDGYDWVDWEPETEEMPEIQYIPQALIDKIFDKKQKIKSKPKKSGGVIEGGRNAYLTHVGGKLRSSGLDYDAIFSALLSVNKKDCNPILSEKEVKDISKSVSKYDAPDMVEEQKQVELGQKIAAEFIDSHQRRIAKQLASGIKVEVDAPENLIPKYGLLANLIDYILKTSVRPQPSLALAAALSYVAAVAGQRYRTETNLRTNTYIIGVANTGHGKDHARKCINIIADKTKTDIHIGGEDIASGQALIRSLVEQPSKLFMLDEFGLKFQAMTNNKNNSYMREIITNFLVLYSSAGSVYRGKEYANRKENPTQKINNPNACLYGTTTPSAFYQSLRSNDALTGTIPRFIIIEADKNRPKRQRPELKYDTSALEKEISKFANVGKKGNLTGFVKNQDSIEVPMDSDVFIAWEQLDDSLDNVMNDEITNAVYSRVAENAAKLSMLYAISINPECPIIDQESFDWAKGVAMWSANLIIARARDFISDTDHEANLKRLFKSIKDAGGDGLTKTQLANKAQFLRSKDRKEIILQLIESGRIVEHIDTKSKRPSSKYIAVKE